MMSDDAVADQIFANGPLRRRGAPEPRHGIAELLRPWSGLCAGWRSIAPCHHRKHSAESGTRTASTTGAL
jgi:hypothetical protein